LLLELVIKGRVMKHLCLLSNEFKMSKMFTQKKVRSAMIYYSIIIKKSEKASGEKTSAQYKQVNTKL